MEQQSHPRQSHPLPTPNVGCNTTNNEINKSSLMLALPEPETPKKINESCSNTAAAPCALPVPISETEILSSPYLKAFTFDQLRIATSNFREDSLLGEGGFGCVYKGWLDEETLTATKPGFGIPVAIKKLIPDGFQGHNEWLVSYFSSLIYFFLIFDKFLYTPVAQYN